MINKIILFCLVFSIVTVHFVECKGGGRGGGGRGGGRGGWGGSRGSGGSFGSWIKGLFGGGKTSSSHTYPASTGLSGHGSGSAHGYPSSNGLSGTGTGQRHGYPASTGLSGSNKYGQRYQSVYSVPSYYTAPQQVYVTQYRQSGSRYNDLLTGLTFYNLGRMHSYHPHYYYHDSYYHRASSAAGSQSTSESTSGVGEENEATCIMRIEEINNEKVEVLKIPCAIVSTFINGENKSPSVGVGTTVCVNTVVQDASAERNKDEEYDVPKMEVICKSVVNATDPLLVQGPPLKYNSNMKCNVEIVTKENAISTEVNCEALMNLAKLSVPENKETIIMPPRNKLKDMMEHPPWWLSLFLAV
ncbi:uncharacterized protein [Choristoneura fumiferana]|uniref:uncharacterized protein n=1 Tax=Choristoneura fumiferana TaxID=7141 RepID=UPI003D15B6C6